jgi:ubiquinone/menaquinone biosynthesis C-methylase UbiE
VRLALPDCPLVTDDVVKVFEDVAGRYDEILPFFGAFAHELASVVPFRPGDRVLDLGAGRGAVAAEALARGCRVTAIDAASGMVERLSADYPAVDARVMDAHHLDFPDGVFDIVVSSFVIHIIDSPARALREVQRVLAPGGLFAFTRPGGPPELQPLVGTSTEDPLSKVFADFERYLPPGLGRMGKPLDESALLTESGFTDVEVTAIGVDLPVPDGETYWQWSLNHGSLMFFRNLPEDRREEAHRRVVTETDALGAFRLRRWASLWMGRKPSGPDSAAEPTRNR